MKDAFRSLVLAIAACTITIKSTHGADEAVDETTGGTAAGSVAKDATEAASRPLGTDSNTERERTVSFELGTGLQYDSNVAVLELDTASNAGDAASLFNFGVGYDAPSEWAIDFRAGYDFSQTRHEDFDGFDVGIHRGSATLAWDAESFDTGASFHYAHADLDGEEFLLLRQVSPYIQRLMGERLFLRLALIHADKAFAGNDERNAEAASLQGDAYVFLDGLTTYLVFGYRYQDEDAVDRQFDYRGHKLKLQLNRRFFLGSRTLTLKTYLRHETRDYAHPTLAIGEPRRDDRYQFEVLAELPISDRLLATFTYKYADNQSNLPSLHFDENVFSARLNATF